MFAYKGSIALAATVISLTDIFNLFFISSWDTTYDIHQIATYTAKMNSFFSSFFHYFFLFFFLDEFSNFSSAFWLCITFRTIVSTFHSKSMNKSWWNVCALPFMNFIFICWTVPALRNHQTNDGCNNSQPIYSMQGSFEFRLCRFVIFSIRSINCSLIINALNYNLNWPKLGNHSLCSFVSQLQHIPA